MSQQPENPSPTDSQHAKKSSLRVLRSARFWLAVVFVMLIAAAVDSCRKPSNQLTARIYLGLVGGYQRAASPVVGYVCRCRFEPSCSHYSVEAVQRFGIHKGLWLTVCRVCRCRTNVPVGTQDPVPETD